MSVTLQKAWSSPAVVGAVGLVGSSVVGAVVVMVLLVSSESSMVETVAPARGNCGKVN